MEKVKLYGFGLSEREARALQHILQTKLTGTREQLDNDPEHRAALLLEDKVSWLITGIETNDAEMAPVVHDQYDESPGDTEIAG
jgi:hypothetical protein